MIDVEDGMRHPRPFYGAGFFYFGETKDVAKKLALIRHGVVEDAFANRYIGKTDVGLSAVGMKQAAAAAGPIGKLGPAHFLVSPLRRAEETARIALTSGMHSFDIDADLREIDFGVWEQKTFAQICAADPESVSRWNDFDEHFVFPEGESLQSFIGRVRALAKRIAADPAETVVAVTHGGVIRFLICHFLGLDFRRYLLFNVHPASVSVIDLYGQTGVLTRLNDVGHLEGIHHG